MNKQLNTEYLQEHSVRLPLVSVFIRKVTQSPGPVRKRWSAKLCHFKFPFRSSGLKKPTYSMYMVYFIFVCLYFYVAVCRFVVGLSMYTAWRTLHDKRTQINTFRNCIMYLHLRVVWMWSVNKPLIHWNQVGESNLENKMHSEFLSHRKHLI